jgi:hypothetical protein
MSERAVEATQAELKGRSAYRMVMLDVFDTCLIRDFVSQESLWHSVKWL